MLVSRVSRCSDEVDHEVVVALQSVWACRVVYLFGIDAEEGGAGVHDADDVPVEALFDDVGATVFCHLDVDVNRGASLVDGVDPEVELADVALGDVVVGGPGDELASVFDAAGGGIHLGEVGIAVRVRGLGGVAEVPGRGRCLLLALPLFLDVVRTGLCPRSRICWLLPGGLVLAGGCGCQGE